MTPVELTEGAGVLATWVALAASEVRRRRAARNSLAERSSATKVQADATLQDDQREFITVLQAENRTWRAEVAKLHEALDALRADMEKLRHQLGVERRAREQAEARYLELLERNPNHPDGDGVAR